MHTRTHIHTPGFFWLTGSFLLNICTDKVRKQTLTLHLPSCCLVYTNVAFTHTVCAGVCVCVCIVFQLPTHWLVVIVSIMPTSNWWVNGIPPKKLPQVGETERSVRIESSAATTKSNCHPENKKRLIIRHLKWAAGLTTLPYTSDAICHMPCLQFILQLDGESIVRLSRGGLLLGNLYF